MIQSRGRPERWRQHSVITCNEPIDVIHPGNIVFRDHLTLLLLGIDSGWYFKYFSQISELGVNERAIGLVVIISSKSVGYNPISGTFPKVRLAEIVAKCFNKTILYRLKEEEIWDQYNHCVLRVFTKSCYDQNIFIIISIQTHFTETKYLNINLNYKTKDSKEHIFTVLKFYRFHCYLTPHHQNSTIIARSGRLQCVAVLLRFA